jgi:dihydrodipicolinate synthase/N-acetylneuraminate lyase
MRPAESIPLTLEEHRELGDALRKARVRIQELGALVAEVYGTNSQAAFSFAKAAEALDRLCVDMQTQAVRDWPGFHTDGFYT